MKTTNSKIIYSIISAVLLLTPIILLAQTDLGLVGCKDPLGSEGTQVCNFDALGSLLVRVINYALGLGLAFSAIAFAWAGVLYLTAGGDSAKIGKAHDIFRRVIVGFIIALSAFVIVDMIAAAFGLSSTIVTLYNSFIH